MATMSMMRKALRTGTMEADRAARMRLRERKRPKRRSTRRARRTLMGRSRGPRVTRERATTTASKQLQLLPRNSRSQWA